MDSRVETAQPESRPVFPKVLLAAVVLVGVMTAWVVVPNFLKGHSSGELTACKSNCKNLATALDMYASDSQGLYPDSLERLVERNYLKSIPTCPATGKVTYTDYTVSGARKAFHFSCVGNNHARAFVHLGKNSDNIPSYTSKNGLLDQP